MRIPNWAQNLTLKVLQDKNCNDIPTLVWRRHNAYSSSGICYNDRVKGITVRAGKHAPRWEQKLVLLHEVAHWLRPNKENHTPEFWKLAFQLYKENKIPIRKAIGREKDYRKGAEDGYREVQNLKPRKTKRKSRQINSYHKLFDRKHLMIIGVKMQFIPREQAWAVIRFTDEERKRWRGYKITQTLYKELLREGYKSYTGV